MKQRSDTPRSPKIFHVDFIFQDAGVFGMASDGNAEFATTLLRNMYWSRTKKVCPCSSRLDAIVTGRKALKNSLPRPRHRGFRNSFTPFEKAHTQLGGDLLPIGHRDFNVAAAKRGS